MASVTGAPEQAPRSEAVDRDELNETEPLLGRPGDAAQHPGVSLLKNGFLGTGIIAQLAVILLFIIVWVGVLTKPVNLFTGHPLAQMVGILVLVESVLILQPTHTPEQKRAGQWVHASFNLIALFSFVAGIAIIEYNKGLDPKAHWHSVHAYLGVATSFVIIAQYLVGFTMWATQALYGGEANAKAIWKYHRYSGYLVLLLLLITVAFATQTPYNTGTLKIKLWAVVLLSVLIVVGVVPRIQKQKLGIGLSSSNN
jgi:cytochrome b-561